MRLLKVTNTPNHVEDGRRNEKQTGDQPTQNGLLILEDCYTSSARTPEPALCFLGCWFLGQENDKKPADCETSKTETGPETVPGQAFLERRRYCKLPGCPTRHSKHLGSANQRCRF